MNIDNVANQKLAEEAFRLYKDVFTDLAAGGSKYALDPSVAKASLFNVGLGLQTYNLKAPSIITPPLGDPLYGMIPVEPMTPVSDVARHKEITAVDSTNVLLDVAEDVAGNTWDVATADRTVTVKYQALGYKVGDTAQKLGRPYEDIRATAVMVNMQKFQEKEVDAYFWGNCTNALGTVSGVAGTASASGGTLATGTYTYKVAALTMTGYRLSQVAGYDPSVTANKQGSTAVSSASSGVSVTGPTGKVTLTWTNIVGAVAWNVYVDVDGGGYKYLATTTTNKYVQTAAASGSVITPPSSDLTARSTEYDGIWNLARAGSLYQNVDMNNTAFTVDGGNSITEINTANLAMANNTGVGVEAWIGNFETVDNISTKITGNATPFYTLEATAGNMKIEGGLKIGSLLDRTTGISAPLIGSRRFPKNKLLGLRKTNPYSYDRIGGNAFAYMEAVGYFGVDYAITATTGTIQQSEIRRYGAMRSYFPAHILIENILIA